MTLGKRQRESLEAYAAILNRRPEIVRLQITIHPRRAYTREFGTGMAITITAYECYAEDEYRMTGEWIANCQYDYTAIEKGQEIARYLVSLNCPKDRIKLRKESKSTTSR